MSPIVERRLAKHFENGAVKYGERNWELGQSLMRYVDSARRHINCWQLGEDDEDHLSAALWNISCIIHTQYMIERGLLKPELDDRPHY